jgi:hypothetical protein
VNRILGVAAKSGIIKQTSDSKSARIFPVISKKASSLTVCLIAAQISFKCPANYMLQQTSGIDSTILQTYLRDSMYQAEKNKLESPILAACPIYGMLVELA